MATAASPEIPINVNTNGILPATLRRTLSSGSREPRVRSILLSGSKPPGLPVHRRDAGEPIADIDARDERARAHPAHRHAPNAQLQVEVVAPDRRPPSIHLSEHGETTVGTASERPSDSPSMPPPPPGMPAPRARRMTLDLPNSPIDVLFETDHKLSLEGTSPKPCIVPGNALHLIDDDPTAPRSATPTSVIVVGEGSEHGAYPETDFDGDFDDGDGDRDGGQSGGDRSESQHHDPPVRPTPRVRFRSRVRITSGMHRHRHGASATGGSTPGSSTSDSPSSSISAPLRYQADENAAWGPIGKRLSAYTGTGGWQRKAQIVQGQRGQANGMRETGERVRGAGRGIRAYNERTPLLRPPAGRDVYSESEDEESLGMGEHERAMRAAALRREEEAVFGKWPWRIFNRHWWWWHVEPVLCCCCSDDSDLEEF